MIIGDKPSDSYLLEMSINYMMETLLILSPKQLACLFLLFDCQPFAENVILKIIIVLMKYSQKVKEPYYLQVVQNIIAKVDHFKETLIVKNQIGGLSNINEINMLNPASSFTPSSNSSSLGAQSISYMIEQKSQLRQLVKDFNVKHKTFLQKVESIYYQDEDTPAEVIAKILLHSRDVQIEKICELLGGKNEQAKKILQKYIERFDY